MSRIRTVIIKGDVYHRLTVIKEVNQGDYTERRVLAKCECGNIKEYSIVKLRAGRTQSCGCFKKEQLNKSRRGKQKLRKGNIEDQSAWGQVLNSTKRGAKRRGYTFKLTLKQIKQLGQQNCYYCGGEPSNYKKLDFTYQEIHYNGIDRVDNTKGYTLDNVVPCCKWCNQAKSDMSITKFNEWLTRLYKHTRSIGWG